jgi:hypothetical protein
MTAPTLEQAVDALLADITTLAGADLIGDRRSKAGWWDGPSATTVARSLDGRYNVTDLDHAYPYVWANHPDACRGRGALQAVRGLRPLTAILHVLRGGTLDLTELAGTDVPAGGYQPQDETERVAARLVLDEAESFGQTIQYVHINEVFDRLGGRDAVLEAAALAVR